MTLQQMSDAHLSDLLDSAIRADPNTYGLRRMLLAIHKELRFRFASRGRFDAAANCNDAIAAIGRAFPEAS